MRGFGFGRRGVGLGLNLSALLTQPAKSAVKPKRKRGSRPSAKRRKKAW